MDIENINETEDKPKGIELTDGAIEHLLSVRRWTRCFSIVGFVLVALFFLGMIIVGTSVKFMPHNLPYYGKALFAVYAIITILFFVPLYGLYNFSARIKEGVALRDSLIIESAFKSLKISVQAIGVLLAAIICLYILVSIITIISTVFA